MAIRLEGRERELFLLAVLLLTGLALLPLWWARFPPMQDYPQHLFVSHVFATFDDPQQGWSEHYRRSLWLGPYALAYQVIALLARVFSIETAGKLYVSGYVLLAAAFVVSEARRRADGAPLPWALLLAFPLLFNPTYYLGLLNYLMAVPLVLFALRAQGGSFTPQALWCGLLFFAHPYAALVYVGLALASASLRIGEAGRARHFGPPLFLLALLGLAFTQGPEPEGRGALAAGWWPLQQSLAWVALTFSGMRITSGASIPALLGWGAVALVLAPALGSWRALPRALLVQTSLCVAGLLALPFSVSSALGPGTYLNVRLAPFCFLLGVWLLSHIALRHWQHLALVGLAALLMGVPARLHLEVSREIEELLPVLDRMEPGQTVVPVYRDATSAWLDPFLFYQLHSHTHDYYHLLVGGGASPNLFALPQPPVQYRSAQSPDEIRARARYVLVRHAVADPPPRREDVRAANGHWTLVERPR